MIRYASAADWCWCMAHAAAQILDGLICLGAFGAFRGRFAVNMEIRRTRRAILAAIVAAAKKESKQ